MRAIIAVALFLGVAAAGNSVSTPAEAQYCQCLCRFDSYGRRHCRRVCTQPRYEPRYEPEQQYYTTYQPAYASQAPFPPEMAAGLLVLLAAGALIAFLSSFTTSSHAHDLAQVEHSTAEARALSFDAESTTHAIDDYIEDTARHHYYCGRAAADREWTGE